MIKPIHSGAAILILMLIGAGSLMAADIPVLPYVEYSIATEGPLSLLCTPDGSGLPMTQAFNPLGQPVDGTIAMILYDDTPPWGTPVAFFPREDIWLTDITGTLALCPAGSIPEKNLEIKYSTTKLLAIKTKPARVPIKAILTRICLPLTWP